MAVALIENNMAKWQWKAYALCIVCADMLFLLFMRVSFDAIVSVSCLLFCFWKVFTPTLPWYSRHLLSAGWYEKWAFFASHFIFASLATCSAKTFGGVIYAIQRCCISSHNKIVIHFKSKMIHIINACRLVVSYYYTYMGMNISVYRQAKSENTN